MTTPTTTCPSSGGLDSLVEAEAPLDLTGISPRVAGQIRDRLLGPDFDAWADAAARVGHCAHPVRLHGWTTRITTDTGEVISSYSSAEEPVGVTYVRCGNRRASVCPSCSRVYAADTFQLIRAGVAGGKTVPTHVAGNPLVFATLTGPSFGHVHHTSTSGQRCRPHSRTAYCRHGRSLTCGRRHDPDDPLAGAPLCPDCYDAESQVIWQWWSPELWRRFTITLRRQLAHHLGVPASRLNEVATVQYAKVAEYQQRGVIHFHALIRLDGPKTDDGYAPAPPDITADDLAALIRHATAAVSLTADPVDEHDSVRVLRFGAQLDTRPVTGHRPDTAGEALTAEQVAGYLAKYATKSAGDVMHPDAPHLRRLRATTRALADRADQAEHAIHAELGDGEPEPRPGPYRLLGKWVHMLGFRGHFTTKSRRYSITLGRLRRARRRYQTLRAQAARDQVPLDVRDLEARLLADNAADESTLVVGSWAYAGTGWNTDGDTALALAAAARAREHAQQRAAARRTPAAR